HDWEIVVHELDRVNEMNDSFLPRDTSDKKQVRSFRIDSIADQRVGCTDRPIFLEIDAIVNHVDAFRIDIKQPLDVASGFAGDGDDRVRHFECGFLDPEGKIVAAGELLALPRPQRFQRVGRDDEWNAVVLFGQNSPEMTVPSVTMNEIGVDVRGVECEITLNGAENRLQRFRTSELTRVEIVSPHLQSALFEILIPEATNIDIDRFRQFAREIAHVDTGAAVNVRRILVSQEEDLHARRVEQASGLVSITSQARQLALL